MEGDLRASRVPGGGPVAVGAVSYFCEGGSRYVVRKYIGVFAIVGIPIRLQDDDVIVGGFVAGPLVVIVSVQKFNPVITVGVNGADVVVGVAASAGVDQASALALQQDDNLPTPGYRVGWFAK